MPADFPRSPGNQDNPEDVARLVALLTHGNAATREQAASALAVLGAPAVEPLIGLLAARDANGPAREQAAALLGQLSDKRAVPALLNTLNDARTEVRWEAVAALGNLGDARAVEPLLVVLHNERDARVRRKTAEALGKIGDIRAILPLVAVLSDHYHFLSAPSAAAADALARIAAKNPVPELRAALPALRDRIQHYSGPYPHPVFETALKQIEAATANAKSLPLPAAPNTSAAGRPIPAAPPAPSPSSLPLPAAAAEPAGDRYSPAPGRWQRFVSWVRRRRLG